MVDLTLNEGKLQLSESLVNLLEANPGDRITVGFASKDGNLVPVITKSDAGNKMSGKYTVIFKGKQSETLAQYGTEFTANKEGDNVYLTGNNPEFKVFTSVQKAVEYKLSKETVLDTNFNIKKIETYEF